MSLAKSYSSKIFTASAEDKSTNAIIKFFILLFINENIIHFIICAAENDEEAPDPGKLSAEGEIWGQIHPFQGWQHLANKLQPYTGAFVCIIHIEIRGQIHPIQGWQHLANKLQPYTGAFVCI